MFAHIVNSIILGFCVYQFCAVSLDFIDSKRNISRHWLFNSFFSFIIGAYSGWRYSTSDNLGWYSILVGAVLLLLPLLLFSAFKNKETESGSDVCVTNYTIKGNKLHTDTRTIKR